MSDEAAPVVPVVVPTPAPVPVPVVPVAVAPAKLPWYISFLMVFGLFAVLASNAGTAYMIYRMEHPAPTAKPHDADFVPLGKTYGDKIASAYADAIDSGADLLEAGQPYSAAQKRVADTWTSGRATEFDKIVAVKLAKIMPDGTKDADVTPAQRAAMAAAWRGLAVGARK